MRIKFKYNALYFGRKVIPVRYVALRLTDQTIMIAVEAVYQCNAFLSDVLEFFNSQAPKVFFLVPGEKYYKKAIEAAIKQRGFLISKYLKRSEAMVFAARIEELRQDVKILEGVL